MDDHLAGCAACREAALRAASMPAAGALEALLGASAPVAEHPEFEELAGYVDGSLDDVASEVMEMHLADCASCREEVADLRAFKARVGEVGGALEKQNQQPTLPPSPPLPSQGRGGSFGDEASGRHEFQVGRREAAQALSKTRALHGG